jgi:HK97 family phage major capsid protein
MSIKDLEEKKALIKELIAKAETDAEIQKYNDQLLSVVEEMATVKAETKLAEQKKAEADEAVKKIMKDAANTPRIEIVQGGNYRGANLKAVVAKAGQLNTSISDASRIDYGKVEAAAKWFTDLVQNAKMAPTEKANVSALTDAQGGYITPTQEITNEVLGYMKQDSLALRHARIVNMTSDKMTIPRELYNAVVAVRKQEGAVGATSATFALTTLSTVGLDGYVSASKEISQDASILVATLMAQFMEATAKKIDSAVFNGTGDPMSGIFSSAITTSATFTGINFSSVTAAAIQKIVGMVLSRPQDVAKLRWFAHPSVMYNNLIPLRAGGSTTTDGPYLFYDSIGGQGIPQRYAGWPIEMAYQAPYTTGAAKTLAVFGDLSGVIIGERLGATSLFFDPYTSAANGLDRFFWFTRFAFNLALINKFGRIRTAAA